MICILRRIKIILRLSIFMSTCVCVCLSQPYMCKRQTNKYMREINVIRTLDGMPYSFTISITVIQFIVHTSRAGYDFDSPCVKADPWTVWVKYNMVLTNINVYFPPSKGKIVIRGIDRYIWLIKYWKIFKKMQCVGIYHEWNMYE